MGQPIKTLMDQKLIGIAGASAGESIWVETYKVMD
jgi:hypothetical protein